MCQTCVGGCSCTSNSSVLPIGPTGATGNTGPAGAAGANGSNGTTVLLTYNNQTGITSGSGTAEESLFLETIPANTWAGDGDEVELYAYMAYSNSDTVTIRLKLAGLTRYTFTQVAANDERIILRIKMSRDTNNSQFWVIEKLSYDVTTGALSAESFIATANSTATNANTNDFEITAQNSMVGANQLTLYKATLYKYTA